MVVPEPVLRELVGHAPERGIYGGRMTDEVSVTREIDAPPELVWAMVADVTRMGEWSPENEGGEWLGGASGPQPGARFRGTNRNGKKKWKTLATVVDAEPGRQFSFRVTATGGLKVAEWRYTFEPTATGCRVTETWIDQRGTVVKTLGNPVSGVADRAEHNRAGMERTLDRLAAAAESD
jgi:uncharacterized protein YndB with AHSA1/START domain